MNLVFLDITCDQTLTLNLTINQGWYSEGKSVGICTFHPMSGNFSVLTGNFSVLSGNFSVLSGNRFFISAVLNMLNFYYMLLHIPYSHIVNHILINCFHISHIFPFLSPTFFSSIHSHILFGYLLDFLF